MRVMTRIIKKNAFLHSLTTFLHKADKIDYIKRIISLAHFVFHIQYILIIIHHNSYVLLLKLNTLLYILNQHNVTVAY